MIEKDKYTEIWKNPNYGKFSPGESFVDLFEEIAKPEQGKSIIDIGCGVGRASVRMLEMTGNVERIDIAENCLERDHPLIPFNVQEVWKPYPKKYDYGFCCDVMEHIPTEYVMLTLKNISDYCDYCFFSINPNQDHFGQTIGEHLHLTIRPFMWWKEHLSECFDLIDARDLIKDCIFYGKSKCIE